MMTNNPLKYRNINYEIPFGLESGLQEKKYLNNPFVRYWVCHKNQNKENNNWVILFHPWGRNSSRMTSRATTYWDNGFSLIFLDARSHGQSAWAKTSKAYDFYVDARKIVETEDIGVPIVHGVSFGSIAASFYAYKYETKAVVLEALPSTLETMFYDFLNSLRLPSALFGWIPWFIMKWDYPWVEFSPVNTLAKSKSPVFLIHGENDAMFSLERHYDLNCKALKANPKHQAWVVPNSAHSKMARHPNYSNKLNGFLEKFELLPNQAEIEKI
ncbi:MAG: hypothetical protein GPJ54_07870 [Candidatus Heimdallarchaeota archaeon]|nr:hypothetical protein [Candidatus Heimdallarchaeota archaeon]